MEGAPAVKRQTPSRPRVKATTSTPSFFDFHMFDDLMYKRIFVISILGSSINETLEVRFWIVGRKKAMGHHGKALRMAAMAAVRRVGSASIASSKSSAAAASSMAFWATALEAKSGCGAKS